MTNNTQLDGAPAWAYVAAQFLLGVGGLAVSVVQLYIMYRLLSNFIDAKGKSVPDPRTIVRRMLCRHRGALARGRDRYGKHTTMCARCGADVNAGKPREEWR